MVDGEYSNSWLSDFDLLLSHITLPSYSCVDYQILVSPNGDIDFDYVGNPHCPMYDATPIFDFLAEKTDYSYQYQLAGYPVFDTTISNFKYEADTRFAFSYDTFIGYPVNGVDYYYHYHVYYRDGGFKIIFDIPTGGNRVVWLGMDTPQHGVTNYVSNDPSLGNFVADASSVSAAFVIGKPVGTQAKDVTEYQLALRLQKAYVPFRNSVEEHLWDITALSRDTATVALNRLSSQAFEPNVGRIGTIYPLKVAGDSLLAGTATGALNDLQRKTLKDVLRLVRGSGLVKYRTIFSDILQLTDSLEVLGDMKNTPSRSYFAAAFYDYQVELGGRKCKIRVRSKAYLVLSPFRLVQILIGRQAITVINDLLALYYSSQPLGEILLTLLQLRKIGDVISSRMFYDLPMYFVHSYDVESQLTKAELDYTGISDVRGDPPRLSYYIRDVSRHLPVLRFSELVAFYGTGDVGNIIWSLFQQLVGILSGGL
jgi:hypothetical protein